MLLWQGVFDGHGLEGRQAAVFAAEEVSRRLAEDYRLQPGKIERQWSAAAAEACQSVRALEH